jgi:RNA-directed DNA polymerase
VQKLLMVKQAELIKLLNPILRGWARYHHPVVAKETFSKLDSLLWWRLRRWARCRHPKKSPEWLTEKYWPTIEGRTEFAARVRSEDGTPSWVRLYRLADTEIVRHRKVMGGYNPFDPGWEA